MAEKGYPLRIILTAVDNATARINAVNARVAALNAPFRAINNATRALGEAAGIEKLRERLARVGEAGGEVLREVGELGKRFLELGGIVGAISFVEIIRGTTEAGDQIGKAAARAGVSNKTWQEFAYVARIADVSTETLSTSFKKLQVNQIAALTGNVQMQRWFARAGVTFRDLKREKPDEIFEKVANKVQKLGKGAKSTAILVKIFGKGGDQLLPSMLDGAKGIEALRKEAEELGFVMSDEAVAAANEFDDSSKRLGVSLIGLRNSIGGAVLPALKPLVDATTKWVVANRELIATKVLDFVAQLTVELPKFGRELKNAWQKSEPFRDAIGEIADKIGIVNLAMISLGAVAFGPLIASFVNLGAALLGAVPGLSTFGIAFAASGIPELIAGAAALGVAAAALIKITQALDKVAPTANARVGGRNLIPFAKEAPNLGRIPGPLFRGRPYGTRQTASYARPGASSLSDLLGPVAFSNLGELKRPGFAGAASIFSGGASSASPSAPVDGRIQVDVNVHAPAGTKVRTHSRGNVDLPVSVGRIMPGAAR